MAIIVQDVLDYPHSEGVEKDKMVKVERQSRIAMV
jgi:hypothetical protein